MTEIACRSCRRSDMTLTYIYRPDPYGSLQRSSAVCRDGCARVAKRDTVRTAIRPGRCAACSRDIIPGDKLTGFPSVHLECA